LTFHKNDQITLKDIINEYHTTLTSRTIIIRDIPLSYTTDRIVKAAQTVGEIEYIDDITNYGPPDKPHRISYKAFLCTYVNPSDVNYIWEKDLWNIQMDNVFLRVLPSDTNNQIYKDRNSCAYRITGLPLNTTYLDLKPLIKKLKGRTWTCTTPKSKFSVTKTANVFVHPKNYTDIKKKYEILDTAVYVLPINDHNYCTYCGSIGHNYQDCNKKNVNNNNSYVNKTRYIPRNRNMLSDQDFKQFQTNFKTFATRSIPINIHPNQNHFNNNKNVSQQKNNRNTDHKLITDKINSVENSLSKEINE